MTDARELYRIALTILTDIERMFIDGLGADPTHMKAAGQFATDVDLAIETYLRRRLIHETGIPVLGEEYGGDCGELTWVVDPIDGTANFAAGNPMSCILISLLANGIPVLAITSVPMIDQRFGAYTGSPLFHNGVPQPPLAERPEVAAHVGFSSISGSSESNEAQFPDLMRHGFLVELTRTYLRPRITGSVGIDLAYTAAGIFGGAVSFSPNIWDNAAGIFLCQAAGATVTDLYGNPWDHTSRGAIVGTARAHETILTTLTTIRTGGH